MHNFFGKNFRFDGSSVVTNWDIRKRLLLIIMAILAMILVLNHMKFSCVIIF